MEKLDTQQVMLGTLIALLRRQFPAVAIRGQIAEGMRLAKQLTVDADIQHGHDVQQELILEDMIAQIDFKSQDVGVYLQPEWSAKEATDKNFADSASDKTRNTGSQLDYTVPTGKTLYITQFSFACHASAAADADTGQVCHARIYDNTNGVYHCHQGGNGGGAALIKKPIVIAGGVKVSFFVTNRSNHNCELFMHAGGYEI